jgi:hypothetical protein
LTKALGAISANLHLPPEWVETQVGADEEEAFHALLNKAFNKAGNKKSMGSVGGAIGK